MISRNEMVSYLDLKAPDQRGVTVVELLVVVVVIAVIVGFALMQRGGANEQFKRQNVAQELKSAFERARFDSVKRRADSSGIQAKVVVDQTTFTLTTDRDQNGLLETSDNEVANLSGQNIVIAGNTGITLPVTITYNQRGEATAIDAGGVIEPVFLVCNVSCASPTQANSNIVLVTPTGTVNLLAGGSPLPTFSPPGGISTVPANTSINNTAVVTPTPSPTP